MIRVDASYEALLASFIDEKSEHMEIVEDHNVAYDAYFYERKDQLSQTMDDIDDGSMKLLSEDEFASKIRQY